MPFISALPTVDPQSVVDGAALWNNGFKNYLINGDFAINQRGFAGGALAAGIYGFDRWKAGTGGCNISLSAGVLTHTSGPLVQVIEAPKLAGKTITVSVEGLTGGNLSVNVEGVAGAIVASSGRSGVSIAVPSTSTGNVTVTLTPAIGTVSYKRVQVEMGSVATAFEWRPTSVELLLCQRYYEKGYNQSSAPGSTYIHGQGQYQGSANAGINIIVLVQFKTEKRVVPAVVIYDAAGSTGKVSYYTTAWNDGGLPQTNFIGQNAFSQGSVISGAIAIDLNWVADSEL